MFNRKVVKYFDSLTYDVNENLHKRDQEIGYRHYCVILKNGHCDWKGKDRLWIEF